MDQRRYNFTTPYVLLVMTIGLDRSRVQENANVPLKQILCFASFGSFVAIPNL